MSIQVFFFNSILYRVLCKTRKKMLNWQHSFPIDRRRWLIDLNYRMIARQQQKKANIKQTNKHTNRHNSIYYCVVNWRLWKYANQKINSIDKINSISTTTINWSVNREYSTIVYYYRRTRTIWQWLFIFIANVDHDVDQMLGKFVCFFFNPQHK